MTSRYIWVGLAGQIHQFCAEAFLVPQLWHPSQRLREGRRASGAFVGHRTLGDYGTKAPAAGDNDGWREGLFVRRWLLASWEAGEAG